ncbi:MAG: CRISPR system precrRNA processing endoribonuclease RAMP protein Cas6 [Thermodesulfobacteriota bacterium]
MLFGRFNFQLIFESEAQLPPFKGSTLRGVFGLALKKVVCALKRQECGLCLLRERCVYTTVFEIPSGEESKGTPSPPHPFIIEPSLNSQTHFQPGDSLDFNLILLGRFNEYLPYFVYAIEQMGRIGIGKKINGKHSHFQLQAVSIEGRRVYDSVGKKLIKAEPEDLLLERSGMGNPDQNKDEIRLWLQTPLRLKFDNRLKAELPFHVLIRGALRRIAVLNTRFGTGEPALDYKGLVAGASAIKIKESNLHWFDWKRYSNRQEQAMLMGGMVGEVTYQGDLKEFLPFLRYCEKVHLGKATTFGLGQIQLQK